MELDDCTLLLLHASDPMVSPVAEALAALGPPRAPILEARLDGTRGAAVLEEVAAASDAPHLLLVDGALPGGAEGPLFREIRNRYAEASVIVILRIRALASVLAFFRNGADDVQFLPLHGPDFRLDAQATLDRNRARTRRSPFAPAPTAVEPSDRPALEIPKPPAKSAAAAPSSPPAETMLGAAPPPPVLPVPQAPPQAPADRPPESPVDSPSGSPAESPAAPPPPSPSASQPAPAPCSTPEARREQAPAPSMAVNPEPTPAAATNPDPAPDSEPAPESDHEPGHEPEVERAAEAEAVPDSEAKTEVEALADPIPDLEALPVGALRIDGAGLLVDCNRQAVTLLAYADAEALRAAWAADRDCLRPGELTGGPLPAEHWPIARALAEGKPHHAFLTLLRADGRRVALRVDAGPLDHAAPGFDAAPRGEPRGGEGILALLCNISKLYNYARDLETKLRTGSKGKTPEA